MNVYAEASDIIALGKNLTSAQIETAEILLKTASSKLRLIASRYGKDIDKLINDEATGEDYKTAVKSIVVQSVCRALNSISDTPPITQESQSALGYNASMTYLNAGQSLYFLRNELKELGILRQQFGAFEVYDYDYDKRNDN
ncbi:MAG: Gp19/Gp15/Gp42 family protein [Oscillospiraceae bacterium]|nr:Gp19/Gp15/Gp42 family protein [Oscillospiraceae bacterium]